MVIVLDGSSQLGRVTIAENAIANFPMWKHLALEVINEAAVPEGADKDFHLQLIKRCVEELEKSDMHLFLTMPSDSPQRELLVLALKPDCITVHLGTGEDEGDYDHTIDSKTHTVNEVVEFLHSIMPE